MELTKLKRINNTKTLPGYQDGFFMPGTPFYNNLATFGLDLKSTPNSINTELAAGIIPAAIGFGTSVYDASKYDKGQQELLSEGGTSLQYANGIGYEAYNGVNTSQFNKDVSEKKSANTLKTAGTGAALGATIGSVVPVLGTVGGGIVGGLVGGVAGLIAGGSMEKEAERQRRLANTSAAIKTEDNRSAAATKALQLQANARNLNPLALLRGYLDGRASDYTGGFARLSNGEVLVKGDLIIDRVPGMPNFKDGVTAYVGDAGVVSNHKIGGIRNSDYVMATGDVQGGLMRDIFWRKQHGKSYKNGKLPGFAEGYLGNLIPSGLGMLASAGQYIDASNLDIRSPQVYSANPYEQSALNDLSNLRINQYPIINLINNAAARADYALNVSGGLSGYQRSRLRAANLYNTLKSISDSLIGAQTQNNAYKANLANAKMQLGNQYAQRMQQSRMFNEEMLAKAHAARQQGKQMGVYNFLNQLLSFYANEFKRRQFNDTMDLYRQNLLLDRDKFNRDLKDYNDIVGVPGMPTPRLYTPSMPLTTGKRLSSNLTPTALWTPVNSQYLLPGSQPYDDYNSWNLKRRGIIR